VVSDEEYVLSKDFAGEHERLQLLEAHVDPLSIAAIEAAGIGPGSRCLEVGAGAGSIARWLAQRVGDGSLVCAIDIDTRLLTPLADEGITVMRHDLLVDDFPARSFDLVHARAVLEHIPAREDALDRIVEWLAPDGALVLVDAASYPIYSSQHEPFLAAMKAWVEVIGRTGTDYDWARTFPEPLQRHGYREVGAAAIAPVLQGGTPVATFWSLTLETLRSRIVEAGLASDAGLDEARRLLADPDFWDFGAGWVAAWGKRPR
jgi:ubiquinone/menaquinone biosynthesis C-methylase UbiE